MSAVLTGVGATAAATPTALDQTPGFVATTTAAPSSSTSSSSTSSTTPTATQSSKSSSSKGAAIGGGIGGAVAVIIIGALLFLLFRKRQNETKVQQQQSWGGSEMGQKYDIAGEPYNRGTMFSGKTDQSDTYNNAPGLAYGAQQNVSPRNPSFTGQQDYSGGYGRDTFYGVSHPHPQPQPSPPPPPGAAVPGPSIGQERYSTFADAGTFFLPVLSHPIS